MFPGSIELLKQPLCRSVSRFHDVIERLQIPRLVAAERIDPAAPGEERILTSPLVLALVLVLMLLCGAGTYLWKIIRRSAADQLYAKAVESLEQGSYKQAHDQFKQFLDGHTDDARVSKARVLYNVAEVRQFASGAAPSWTVVLEKVRKMIDAVGKFKEYDDEKTELAEIVLRAAEGLADRTKQEAQTRLQEAPDSEKEQGDPKSLKETDGAIRLLTAIAGKSSEKMKEKSKFPVKYAEAVATVTKARVRLESLGNRRSEVTTDQAFANAGFRGSFGNSWEWEANAGFGRMGQATNISGYLLKDKLAQALGPSFIDASGAHCGTPGAVIAGCTPINMFNVEDPAQIAALKAISTNYRTDYTFRSSQFTGGLNGDLFDLPAGAVKAAFGVEYRSQEGQFETDSLTRGVAPLYLSCLLAQETCTGNSSAKYNVRELYGEFFVPLVADKPGVQALNLTAGVRYSDYSKETIGDDTTFEAKLEYRPVRDVLVRASYAEVFRAPTINDLALAPTQSAATFNDPCASLTSAQLAANPNLALACVGVAPDTGFSQPNSQITSLLIGTPTLKPETGDVLTAGFVYDSSLVRGLSLNVDYWKYKIDNVITALDVNFAADQCVQTGNPDFCGLMHRYETGPNAGEFLVFELPNVNLGSLETDGIDVGIRYQLRDTALGSWNFQLEATHINSFAAVATPGAPAVEVAGTFDPQYGNYAKWRGVFGIGWSMAGFDGLLTTRYFDSLVIKDADGLIPDQRLDVPSVAYLDLTLGYTYDKTHTRIQLGVQNLTDKAPPLMYQNNVTNANTDVSTYDLLGRQWYLGVTQKF